MIKETWYKTNRKEVFGYILRYEKFNYEQTGTRGVFPRASLIAKTFKISNTRAGQYMKMFKEQFKKLK
jgi:hypothetical protein